MRRLAAIATAVVSLGLVACGSTVPVAQRSNVSAANSDGVESDLVAAGPTDAASANDDNTATTAAGTARATTSATRGHTAAAAPTAAAVSRGTGPVKVGFLVTKDVGGAMAALGYKGLSTGDGANQARAVAKLINAKGGLGGRKIEPVVFELDPTNTGPEVMQSVCSQWFDDNKVVAAISILPDPIVMDCTNKHGAPFVGATLASPTAAVLRRYPLVTFPQHPGIEVATASLVDGLVEQGWFKPADATEVVTVGLITHELPAFAGVKEIVEARLRAAGLSLRDTYYMPASASTSSSDIPRASSAGQAAALKFKSEGINRVIAMDSAGFGYSWFSVSAASQSYYPRLGVSTLGNPATAPAVLSPKTMAGARGIGWAPMWDTSVDRQTSPSARTEECLKALRDAGEDVSAGTVRLGSLPTCDAAFALSDAWHSGDVSARGFQSGIAALGTGFLSSITFATNFARSRAAASSYKAIAYDAGCNCFQYQGALRQFS